MKKYSAEIQSVCDSVTGSQTLLVIHRNSETIKILIDCGWNFELDQDKQWEITKKPDVVILTHAHTDHIACIPKLCKTYGGPIYTSKDTKQLAGISLSDSYAIQKNVEKLQGIPKLFEKDDIIKSLSQFKSIKFLEKTEIADNIFFTLIPNSHIPGSSCVYIEIGVPEYCKNDDYDIPSMNFFFTGDLKTKDNPFLDDTIIPEYILEKPVYIISESTYGGEGRERIKVFKQNIETKVKEKKKIIVPVLSLGRAQQIMLELKNMQKSGRLDKKIPIFVDGKLLNKYTNKYKKSLDVKIKDFEPENICYVSKKTRPLVSKKYTQCIIIASSGNASFGPSNEYVANHIEDENALIHFTSFQPENTLGRRLLNTKRNDLVEVNGVEKKLRAEIRMTSEYSSHDEKEDLVKFITNFKNIKGVFVTHGEEDARENLINILKKEISDTHIFNLNSRKFIRIDRLECGVVKEINSKISKSENSKKCKKEGIYRNINSRKFQKKMQG